ncbi:MAG: hypothetical protein ACHQNT_08980 [Bacteroidia bacterium]
MKAIIFSAGLIFVFVGSNAQEIKRDTVNADSIQLQKIYKMPMDTSHLLNADSTRILHPDFSNPQDSILRPKTIDDADPKRPKK